MKKSSRKLGQRTRQRRKFALKAIITCCTITAGILIKTSTLFTFSNIERSKADQCEFIELQEQSFSNDMSIPSPEINHGKKAGQNSIFIHRIISKSDLKLITND